jgi:alanyl-tRNA synthetase
MQYTTDSLRTKWLEFFKSKDHAVIPSAGVVPENDPTALFINSGMHPLVPFLMGEPHPLGTRLANSQKAVRTGDIEEVGDATHLTFFEMLGNWSLGDFFKEDQIAWSFEFLTQELELPLRRLAVSVFEGDANAPRDEEAAALWKQNGMPEHKIAYLDAAENWWAKGETGPCGPDSEMFYWTGDPESPELDKPYQETWEDPRWVEIWNDVFMQFNKLPDGSLEELPAQNVDTGMGLERTVAVLNGKTSVYETDAFTDILKTIAEVSGFEGIVDNPVGDSAQHNSARIVADHLRSATVILADGVAPANVDQGYILRRLIRRAVRHGRKLGIESNFCHTIAKAAINKLGSHYPELIKNESFIIEELQREESQFRTTLEKGEKQFQKVAANADSTLSGEIAFDLYQTYGFPIEMTEELAAEAGLKVDSEGFIVAEKAHQALSKAGAEGKFKGGMSRENIEEETGLHTATHLLLAGLREVLGTHVHQAGSNITAERLRFDFTHGEKMTPEEKTAVEAYVNDAIAANAEQVYEEVAKVDAEQDATIEASFWERYPDVVKVFTFKDDTGKVWTRELCGGPHVKNTSELGGAFKIKKEESSSRGVRRIKAVLVK